MFRWYSKVEETVWKYYKTNEERINTLICSFILAVLSAFVFGAEGILTIPCYLICVSILNKHLKTTDEAVIGGCVGLLSCLFLPITFTYVAPWSPYLSAFLGGLIVPILFINDEDIFGLKGKIWISVIIGCLGEPITGLTIVTAWYLGVIATTAAAISLLIYAVTFTFISWYIRLFE